MTPWMRIVTLAAVGSLIAGAALAQPTAEHEEHAAGAEHAAPSAVALGPAVAAAEGVDS